MKEADLPEVSAIYSQALIRGNSTFNTMCPELDFDDYVCYNSVEKQINDF